MLAPSPRRGLSIGDLAARTGLAPSAIRYYEEEGLVHPVRSNGGTRRFDRADIRRLSFVMIAQGLGFSLSDIRVALAGLPTHRAPSKSDWSRIAADFREVLDARISRMTELRARLDGCIGCGCLSLEACALYNPADRAARRGSGPRYLLGDSVGD